MKNKLLLLLLLVGSVSITYSQQKKEIKEGTFTDSRDGKTYKTVTIPILLEGGVYVYRTWFAQNLNYKSPESFCYKNESAYCEVYGRLYTFDAAMKACPDGWHVPTIGEWNLVLNTYGGLHESGLALQAGGESKLNLLLGGFGDPGKVFKNIGVGGNYWDAEKKSSSTAGLISIQKDSEAVFHSSIGNWHRNSCRCVKNYD